MTYAVFSEDDKLELIEALEAKISELERNAIVRYKPSAKQRKFHAAGANPANREILLMAANQSGKTYAMASELSYHLTGLYPDWWEGARWDYAPTGWASSNTAQGTRDSVQRLLMGRPEEWGTGTIPGDLIVSIKRAASAVPDCIETVTVRHVSGGFSRLTFKTYDQGRKRWQAETLDFLWADEEPPEDIYFEGITRTNATQGLTWLTFTPLMGMSNVVKRYLKDKAPGTYVVHMTLEDAEHYTPEERAAIMAKYPAHQLKARAQGLPVLGSGLIYPVDEQSILVDPFPIPAHWARICGLDFGWDHPGAAAWLAHDRDTDVVYLYDSYRQSQATPVMHAAAIKSRGDWIPVAWPHDGLQSGKDGGKPLRTQYHALGVKMLPAHATHSPEPGAAEGTGGYAVEPGVMLMLDRMQTGRFKVFSNQTEWLEEQRLYHRKDGVIVKEDDDLLDAGRTGLMMLRHARTRPAPKRAVTRPFTPFNASMGY